MNIELNIKELLKRRKATVEDLAKYINVTRPGLYGMMRNGTITLEKLKLTSEYFGVTIAQLIGEKNLPGDDPILSGTIREQAEEISMLKRMILRYEQLLQTTEHKPDKNS